MDFFSAAAPVQEQANQDAFAQAINSRFSSAPAFLAMPSISSPDRQPATSPPIEPPAQQPASNAAFLPISPAHISPYLTPETLILDIRPYHSFSNARLPSALPLTVPSTLLKRPNFSLHRLSMMLPSQPTRTRFQSWATFDTIIVYDADSASLSTTSNVHGLLKKFRHEGFSGTLGWLQGGFQSFWRDQRSLVETSSPLRDTEDDDDEVSLQPSKLHASGSSEPPLNLNATPTMLVPKRLPMSAFHISSTTAAGHKGSSNAPAQPESGLLRQPAQHNSASNPFYDTVRQNVELEQGITEKIPLQLPFRVRRRIKDLPFPWLRSIAKTARPQGSSPPEVKFDYSSMSEPPSSSDVQSQSETDIPRDKTPKNALIDEGTEALAMQFYRIELAEQRRLMSVMTQHTQESTLEAPTSDLSIAPNVASFFPYSITAGIEKGAKNRYRHIWPFEHARVKLRKNKDAPLTSFSEVDDYVNASYVQPLGTNKRYIATQGPLEATFRDFWTLCWEQDIHVIVMLTQQFEGTMEKCANYWSDGTYGQIRLKLVSTDGNTSNLEKAQEAGGFFAPMPSAQQPQPSSSSTPAPGENTVKRVFELIHLGYPFATPRRVIQLQYLGWPDMNVPKDPRGLLDFVREVNDAVQETNASSGAETPSDSPSYGGSSGDDVASQTGIWKGTHENRPVLLHCSAGVGRTGGFIAIDAILDGIRREVQSLNRGDSASPKMKMDVDPSPNPSSNPRLSEQKTASGGGSSSNKTVPAPHPPLSVPQGPTLNDIKMDVDRPAPTTAQNTQHWVQGARGDSEPQKVVQPQPVPSGSLAVDFTPDFDVRSNQGTAGSVDERPLSESPPPTRQVKPTLQFPSLSASMHPEKAATVPVSEGAASAHPHDRLRAFSAPSQHKVPRFGARGEQPYPTSSIASSIMSIPTSSVPSPSPSPSPFYRSRGFSGGQETTGKMEAASGAPQKPLYWLGSDLRKTLISSSPGPMEGPSENSSLQTNSSSNSNSQGVSSPNSRSLSPLQAVADPMSALLLSSSGSSAESSQLANLESEQAIQSSQGGSSQSSSRAGHILDYKIPRTLHGSTKSTPHSLSTYDDPISTVLQDMREQRMSLVQTLRQYVFIHAAIIEGALQIVDEEAQRLGKGNLVSQETTPDPQDTQSRSSASVSSAPPPAETRRASQDLSGTVAQFQGSSNTSSNSGSVASTSTGKRGPSPTELVEEDKEGVVKLNKKPSMKRPARSSDGSGQRSSRSSTPARRIRPQLGDPQHTMRP